MVFIGIIVSIILFSIIVLIHEYGHYKTAKIFGIHIEEFGLGIPPRARKLWKNKQGTLFSLNWIPLGGFVKISGESELSLSYYDKHGKKLDQKHLEKKCKHNEEIHDEYGNKISHAEKKFLKAYLHNEHVGKNFHDKHILKKSGVLVAGVVMNFLLAAVIFSVLFFVGVKPVGINSFIPTELPSKIIPTFERSLEEGIIVKNPGIVLFPIEGSLAELSGIQGGDILISANGKRYSEITALQDAISKKKSSEIHMYLKRQICEGTSDCYFEYDDIYITTSPEGKIGSYLSPNYEINTDLTYKYGLGDSIKYGVAETYYQSRLTLSGLGLLLKNIISPEVPEDREDALEQVAGPIGIVNLITQSLEGGIILIVILGAIISVNLGVFNLLPIPALDGGRLLLLWIRSSIDALLGKNTLSVRLENITHVTFFLLLIALSILIAYNDIIKIFS